MTSQVERTITINLNDFRTFPTDRQSLDEFEPAKIEKGARENAFAKDWDRLSENLIYNGQSIAKRFKKELNAQDQNKNLGQKVQKDVDEYLRKNLGLNRQLHLREEINWRFSQKALTQICHKADKYTIDKYQGIFRSNKHPIDKISLEFTQDKKYPVQITATRDAIYNLLFVAGTKADPIDLPTPIRFTAKAIYRIGMAPTVCKAEFCFERVKKNFLNRLFDALRAGFSKLFRCFFRRSTHS